MPSLDAALSAWLESAEELLAWAPGVGPSAAAVERQLTFDRDGESRAVVVRFRPDRPDRPVEFSHGRKLNEQERASLARLRESHRILLGLFGLPPWELQVQDALTFWPHGRALVETERALPSELKHVGVIHTPNLEGTDLSSLVRLISQVYPDYAIELLRPAAEARNVDATAWSVVVLAGRDPEESSKWRTRLETRRQESQRR
jgi:hypothetical protein